MALYVSQITGEAGRDMAWAAWLVVEVDETQDTAAWAAYDLSRLQRVARSDKASAEHELVALRRLPCIVRADLATYTFLVDD